MNTTSRSDSYAAAGVDITAGYKAVELMKAHIAKTMTAGALSDIGGFGGLFELDLTGMTKPVLVSGTDGVGTKLKLAFLMDKHDTVGIDCVAMCVNDIVCVRRQPLFFLDYIACGKNHPGGIADIVSGIAEGCVQAECALVGGETAEMPGFYPVDEYDLAGFSVGVVDKDKVFDKTKMPARRRDHRPALLRRPLQRLLPGAQGPGRGARGPEGPCGGPGRQVPGRDAAGPHPHLCQEPSWPSWSRSTSRPSPTSPAAASMKTSPAACPRA